MVHSKARSTHVSGQRTRDTNQSYGTIKNDCADIKQHLSLLHLMRALFLAQSEIFTTVSYFTRSKFEESIPLLTIAQGRQYFASNIGHRCQSLDNLAFIFARALDLCDAVYKNFRISHSTIHNQLHLNLFNLQLIKNRAKKTLHFLFKKHLAVCRQKSLS